MQRLSIVIPALNEEKLLDQVLGQFTGEIKDEFNIEIIVSDGGSIDNTLRIAHSKADKVVFNNNGFKQNISKGRNSGAEISTGDVLIFFNADTYVKRPVDFLKSVVRILRDDNIVAIACPVRVFELEENLFDRLFHFLYNYYVKFLNYGIMGMGRGECHIVRKDVFRKIGGYNESLTAGEDFELYKRLFLHGRIKFDDNLVVYESPRRYRKFGYARVFWDWLRNSVWITLFKKSLSRTWEQVR